MAVLLGSIKGRVKVFKVYFKDKGSVKSEIIIDDLEQGDIVLTNQWRKANPKKDFIQLDFNGYTK